MSLLADTLSGLMMGLIADLAIIVIALFFCRATGRKIPDWIPMPRSLRDRLNDLIDPDARRLDRLMARLGVS